MFFVLSVVNRIYNLVRVCPHNKQGIASTIDLICLMKFVCIPNIQKSEFALCGNCQQLAVKQHSVHFVLLS